MPATFSWGIEQDVLAQQMAGANHQRLRGPVEASMGVYPNPKYVYAGIDRGDGTLGTLHASNISAAAGAGSDLSASILKSGEAVDDVTGAYSGASGGCTAHMTQW